MRVLFTADLHINLRQKNVPKDWSYERYKIMFDEIDRVYDENYCELLVIGGDIFDKMPSLEELNLFLNYLKDNSGRETILYDGNHEATKRGDTFLKYLEAMVPSDCHIIVESGYFGNMYILPYCELKQHRKDTTSGAKICLTHVRGEIPPHVKPEVDLRLFDNFGIVFAGDLHAHSNSQRNIVYPGSPTTVTFHRNPVETGVIVFDNEDPGSWEWHEVYVPQLIRMTVDDPAEMIKTNFNHTIYELKGDILDLAKVKDSEILDKKIIEHQSEASLDLVDKTLSEELSIYCNEVLQLPVAKIDKVLRIFNDNTTEIRMA